jgi:DNA-binding MarR family transcriptional regulator
MSNKSPAERRTPAARPARARRHAPARARSVRAGRNARPGRDGLDLGLLPGLLGYRLRLAQRAVFDDFARSVEPADISPGLFGILVIIEANPGLKQSELAATAQLDRSSIVPVVDKLEARGYVMRRAAEHDRRVNGLWLTPNGGALLRALKRRVLAHEARILSGLTPAERGQLLALLSRLVNAPHPA